MLCLTTLGWLCRHAAHSYSSCGDMLPHLWMAHTLHAGPHVLSLPPPLLPLPSFIAPILSPNLRPPPWGPLYPHLLDGYMIWWAMQGEMIQAKFGLVAVAERQLETYSTAVLLATESPPKPPRYPAPPSPHTHTHGTSSQLGSLPHLSIAETTCHLCS